MVPHSHIDTGWIKTIDQYYSGSNQYLQWNAAAVRDIFDTVIEELQKDPKRKFCFAEISYFKLWWEK